jgi:hypothetical protein
MAIERNPAATATQLREAHRALLAAGKAPEQVFRTDRGHEECGKFNDHFRSPSIERLTYGLARGPSIGVSSQAAEQIENAISTLEGLRPEDGLGLEDGRPPEGIATLIENYLRMSETADEQGRDAALQRLSDGLVQFAEKILFISNNDFVLRAGIADGYRRGIDRYVLGLQAIGNQIMVQANELRERQRHRSVQRERAPAERIAIRRALLPPPAKLLDDIVSGLNGKRDAALKSAAAAGDALKLAGREDSFDAAAAALAVATAESTKNSADGAATAEENNNRYILDAWATLSGDERARLRTSVVGDADKAKTTMALIDFLTEVETWTTVRRDSFLATSDGAKTWSRVVEFVAALKKKYPKPGSGEASATRADHFDTLDRAIAVNYADAVAQIAAKRRLADDAAAALD